MRGVSGITEQTAKRHVDALGDADRVIYHITHDLRASIRAILELPNWIKEDLEAANAPLPEDAASSLRLLQTHALRLNLLMDGLVEFSRVGRECWKTLAPKEVLSPMLAEFSATQGVTLRAQLGAAEVRMAEKDLERIFLILIKNAIVHHPTAPKISIVGGAYHGFWVLRFRDDGIGVPLNKRETVFEPMVRLISRDEQEGAGMGLAILSKIVSHYGGEVCIEAPPKGRSGTTICLRLPLETSPTQ